MSRGETQGPYLLFMLALSVFALILLGVHSMVRLDPAASSILSYADNAVCVFFLLDFFLSLYRAPNRVAYFLRWGWLDLLSSIPMIEALRVGRAARVLRILRVLRGIRSTKILSEFVLRRRTQGAFLAAILVSFLLIVISSIAILQFETSAGANIKTAEDAVWWSVVTLTTVGYGDHFPISTEGRLLASILMVAGVGLFGALSGFIAAWFLRPDRESSEVELDMVLAELRELRAMVESQRAGAATQAPTEQP